MDVPRGIPGYAQPTRIEPFFFKPEFSVGADQGGVIADASSVAASVEALRGCLVKIIAKSNVTIGVTSDFVSC